MTTTTSITIFSQQNVGTIAQLTPQAYQENNVSHDRCLQFGQELLNRVSAEGMSDALDQEIAVFIERAKKTLKKMNGKRAPVTQLFDSIRTAYTTLENDIDPAKRGTTPAQLQECRNRYAAQKREQEQRRREEAAKAQRVNQEREQYASGCADLLRQMVNARLNDRLALIRKILAETTLSNYDLSLQRLQVISTDIDMQNVAFQLNQAAVALPLNSLDITEREEIRARVCREHGDSLAQSFRTACLAERDQAVSMMPSKRAELQRMAAATQEEAERIKRQMEERERAEAAQRERERAEREAKEKAAAELAAQKQEMNNLFGASQLQAAVQTKAKVKKVIEVLDAEGFMPVIGMWWAQHGSTLSVEELTKIFSKQLNYCNKLANDRENPVFIQSEHIRYIDEVKAK